VKNSFRVEGGGGWRVQCCFAEGKNVVIFSVDKEKKYARFTRDKDTLLLLEGTTIGGGEKFQHFLKPLESVSHKVKFNPRTMNLI
jgi:hypothetical protein